MQMKLKMDALNVISNLQPPTNSRRSITHNNSSATNSTTTAKQTVVFTTPNNYAGRLSHLLHLKGWIPLWCPTVFVESTPHTHSSLLNYLSNPQLPLQHFSAIAFTSRTGISSFAETLTSIPSPPLPPFGDIFTISALGKDSELIDESFIGKICNNHDRIRVLVPPVATPSGLVDAMGFGHWRSVLCPVPAVVGLEEPPVVPDFLKYLRSKGWVAVRVNGYETRWAGRRCAEELVRRSEAGAGVDAIVFTSTAEVEGLLKSLKGFGLDWDAVRERFPSLIVAAHGPVTAAGAARLGVDVDVVSSRFGSFEGVVDALALQWQSF